MEDITLKIVEWISNADNVINNLEENAEQLVGKIDANDLPEYEGYLRSACELLEKIEQALNEKTELDTLDDFLIGSVLKLTDEKILSVLEDHSTQLDILNPENTSKLLKPYVFKQLMNQYYEFKEGENNQGWFTSNEVNRDAILHIVEQLRNDVCEVSGNFNNVVEIVTLKELRDVLAETSAALKDVVIIGADITVITTDITFLMAVKSGYSIVTGIRSLRQRVRGYRERFANFFNN